MGIIAPGILSAIFLGWILYRSFVTKDIKKYKNEVFGGFFFIGIWIVIYTVLVNIS
jgi:hypothetical protein